MATAPTQNLSFPQPTLPERLEDSEEYRQVLAMTQRLFPGPINIRRQHDPELPEEYVVFEAGVSGSLSEILERDAEWRRECGSVAPTAFHLYHLALMFGDDTE